MIAVDTNVVAYLLLGGDLGDASRALLRADRHWVAPRLLLSELRNVMALHMKRRGLALDDARVLMEKAEALLADALYELPSRQVLQLAEASACSAYDCEFVALARALGVKLVTNDRAILRSFPEECVALGSVSAQP